MANSAHPFAAGNIGVALSLASLLDDDRITHGENRCHTKPWIAVLVPVTPAQPSASNAQRHVFTKSKRRCLPVVFNSTATAPTSAAWLQRSWREAPSSPERSAGSVPRSVAHAVMSARSTSTWNTAVAALRRAIVAPSRRSSLPRENFACNGVFNDQKHCARATHYYEYALRWLFKA